MFYNWCLRCSRVIWFWRWDLVLSSCIIWYCWFSAAVDRLVNFRLWVSVYIDFVLDSLIY